MQMIKGLFKGSQAPRCIVVQDVPFNEAFP